MRKGEKVTLQRCRLQLAAAEFAGATNDRSRMVRAAARPSAAEQVERQQTASEQVERQQTASEQVERQQTAAERLLDALRAQPSRVIDVFRRLDEDMSGAIEKPEFRQVLLFLSREDRTSFGTDKSAIDEAFDLLDADGSGTLELRECDKLLRCGYKELLDRKLQAGAAGEIALKATNSISLRTRDTSSLANSYGGGGRGAAGGTATAHLRSLRGGELAKEGARTVVNSHKLEVHVDIDADGDGTRERASGAVAALAHS